MKTTKEPWESLKKKHKMEDIGTKKFIIGNFLDFKIIDKRIIINQLQHIQLILHDIVDEGMILCESFQVAAIIEKLSLLWKYFKNYLKHNHEEIIVEDWIVHL